MEGVLNVAASVLVPAAAIAVFLAARAVRVARKREAAAVQEAERAQRIKTEFVAMVSHELRTPLTAIAGFTETLLGSWVELSEEEVAEFLEIINTESKHLSDLVEDVLVMPRLEAGRLPLDREWFDLSSVVHQITDMMFPPGSEREAAVAIPAGTMAYADRRRTLQILRNLVENAGKYGGDQILVEATWMGSEQLITVADNGPGVPPEEAETIFESFEQLSKGNTRTAGGVGLGLPIARKLAIAMGGDVWYESRFPTGSRFCFTLPGRPEETEEAEGEEQDSAATELVRSSPASRGGDPPARSSP
jgi:signal transduction histidine kinase